MPVTTNIDAAGGSKLLQTTNLATTLVDPRDKPEDDAGVDLPMLSHAIALLLKHWAKDGIVHSKDIRCSDEYV